MAPLRHRRFRLLFSGRIVSFAGSAMAPIALAFAVLGLGGSATDLGLVLTLALIPRLLLILVGGVVADRLPRSAVMVGSNLVSGGAQLAAAGLLLSGRAEIWQLALLAVLSSAAASFFFPASQGIVPQTVPAKDLQSANALLRLAINTTTIAGAAVGGALVAAAGAGWAIAFDGVTFLVSAAILTQLQVTAPARDAASSFGRELADGWREFRTRTWLWVVVAGFSFSNAASASAFGVLGPVVAEESLGGAGAWGLVLAAQGVGLLVGSLIALRIRPHRPLAVGVGVMVLTAPPLALLAVQAPVGLLALFGAAVGVCDRHLQRLLGHEPPGTRPARPPLAGVGLGRARLLGADAARLCRRRAAGGRHRHRDDALAGGRDRPRRDARPARRACRTETPARGGITVTVVNELEALSLAAYRSFYGDRATVLDGGAVVFRIDEAPGSPMLNRVVGLGVERPASDELLDSALQALAGATFYVAESPSAVPPLGGRLRARGLEPSWGWMQFRRGVTDPPAGRTELELVDVGPGEAAATFARIVRIAYGLPEAVEAVVSGVVNTDWQAWLALDGDEPAGAAALFVQGEGGYLGFAGTLPEHRGKGAQSALLAARIRRARELGCRWVATETGERQPGRVSNSYRNIIRAGFEEQFVVGNWLSSAQVSDPLARTRDAQ